MEEKILVKSKSYNVKKFFVIMVIIGAILSISMFLPRFKSGLIWYDNHYEDYIEHEEKGYCPYSDCWSCEEIKAHPTKIGYALNDALEYDWWIIMIPLVAYSLIGAVCYFSLSNYDLTVTDKRVFGRVSKGKRVDLPVDSVSAISTVSLFKGVSVSTPSGMIKFLMMKNADEIYNVLNNLLIERQQKKADIPASPAPNNGSADELKKYKELFDSGVITAEEFEAKKKQLLGL